MGAVPLLLLTGATLGAASSRPAPELSAGFSSVFYAHAVEYATSSALALTLSVPLAEACTWSSGARLGLAPVATEVFGRFSATPRLGRWRPALGLELGVTARSDFSSGPVTRREIRRPVEHELKPYYAAFHASLLSFDLGKGWSVSLCELRIGTHVIPMGRFARLELGFVSLGHAL